MRSMTGAAQTNSVSEMKRCIRATPSLLPSARHPTRPHRPAPTRQARSRSQTADPRSRPPERPHRCPAAAHRNERGRRREWAHSPAMPPRTRYDRPSAWSPCGQRAVPPAPPRTPRGAPRPAARVRGARGPARLFGRTRAGIDSNARRISPTLGWSCRVDRQRSGAWRHAVEGGLSSEETQCDEHGMGHDKPRSTTLESIPSHPRTSIALIRPEAAPSWIGGYAPRRSCVSLKNP